MDNSSFIKNFFESGGGGGGDLEEQDYMYTAYVHDYPSATFTAENIVCDEG